MTISNNSYFIASVVIFFNFYPLNKFLLKPPYLHALSISLKYIKWQILFWRGKSTWSTFSFVLEHYFQLSDLKDIHIHEIVIFLNVFITIKLNN